MEFHEKLQELRKQKGLTQEALASALFVSRTAVSKWESGRGYPNIDSLKAIAKFFGVSVDELLSGEEALNLAEADTKQKETRIRNRVFGLLDCSMVIFFFLPLFGQTAGGIVQTVSLLGLTELQPWLKVCYFAVVVAMILIGVLTLALQKTEGKLWAKAYVSLVCNGLAALLFILSRQPYGAAVVFVFAVIKAVLLIKKG